MAKKDTALTPAEEFRLVQHTDGLSDDILAEIADELDDLDSSGGPEILKIKVPSSGGLAFEVQDGDGGVDYMKTIDGVIVLTHAVNGYWSGSFGDSGNPADRVPLCSSMDGTTGLRTDTGEAIACRGCPFNEYGTAIGKDGQRTRGKACKNMRRLYIMRSDDPNLYLLTVPPTSVREVNRAINKLLYTGTPYIGTIVRLSLEKTKNAGGTDYSKIVIRKIGELTPEVRLQAQKVRRRLKDQYRATALTLDDYAPVSPLASVPVESQSADPAPASMALDAAPVFETAGSLDDGENDLPF